VKVEDSLTLIHVEEAELIYLIPQKEKPVEE
jgi:hypothetical protein